MFAHVTVLINWLHGIGVVRLKTISASSLWIEVYLLRKCFLTHYIINSECKGMNKKEKVSKREHMPSLDTGFVRLPIRTSSRHKCKV